MTDDMTDIYSAANIARSRARAAAMREAAAVGLYRGDEAAWLTAADEVDAYADEREAVRLARESGATGGPSGV